MASVGLPRYLLPNPTGTIGLPLNSLIGKRLGGSRYLTAYLTVTSTGNEAPKPQAAPAVLSNFSVLYTPFPASLCEASEGAQSKWVAW